MKLANHHGRAALVLDDGIADAERRVDAVEAASRERLHADVREALRAQNAAARASGGVAASLAKLDQPGISVVVTGQQVGLFGGPLYALHKACAAVRLARRLERESGRPVVPVFWLQSEDHDRREIASATLWDAEGDAVVVRAAFDAEARSSVAHDRRIEGVARARAGAVDAWRGQPFEADARALLEASWTDDRGWVDAFASFAQAMLGDEGLLVFSPRTARLAERAKELHAWATREHIAVATALERRAEELARAGFAPQVPLRSDCCLSFVHPDGAHGDRFRLRRRGAAWEAAGASARYTDEELTDLIASEPLRFSS
jgi:uncharacterized protein YllA (UPF0747 family)